ncbi:hypothetical protein RSOLAG1IB_10870 [Rhizoctonia solani AG-1 IB]|uniref:Uncharacterized protein n=1 Tax=Thanatephorus cucumeris (strain AG1-IB / isolate 7/3/14) TaxID=1108050 RepID=A0A0B7G580_THACB|nr:hypothetical protein RSOLAG1IB_10870 [Rhizoctonia solani AG-1 IB]
MSAPGIIVYITFMVIIVKAKNFEKTRVGKEDTATGATRVMFKKVTGLIPDSAHVQCSYPTTTRPSSSLDTQRMELSYPGKLRAYMLCIDF